VSPRLFGARVSRRPAAGTLVAALLLAPVLLLPNPQDVVIAQQQQIQEAAERQAERIDRVVEDLESKGLDANDPRTQLAEELRELALRLRQHPEELDANLARLGAIEDNVRAQIDPANEQRAASLASLSRALSRAATGSPEANKDGDPDETKEDLADLGEKLDELTPAGSVSR
jgi:septal ring factor EnvC (AmiA/AmiB activator)